MTLNLPPNAPNCDANLTPGDRYTDADTGFVWVYQGTRNNANGDAVPIWLPLNEAERGNIIYRGPINLTQDPSAQYADIVSGNVFNITTGANPVDSSLYPGLTGDQSELGEIIFDGTNYSRLNPALPYATETVAGKIEIATQDEVTNGTSTITAVVPAYLKTELNKQLTAPATGVNGQWLQRLAGAGSWQNLPQATTTQQGVIQLAVSSDLQDDPLSQSLAITPAVLMGAIGGISSTPTGVVQWYAGSTPPEGWLECNGQTIIQTDYPALYAIVGDTVPDLRGEFIRGWDHNRGIDNNRNLLSAQSDEFKAHKHETSLDGRQIQYQANAFGMSDGSQRASRVKFSMDETGGTETRPRNIAMMGIIKT